MRGELEAEFREMASGYVPAEAWRETVACFGSYIAEGPGSNPWGEVADRVARCVEDERPGSFVRLGDGEGNVLATTFAEHQKLTEECLALSSTRHLGTPDALNEALPELLPAYRSMLRNADVIGFPGPFGVGMMLKRGDPEFWRPAQGLIYVHRYLSRFRCELRLRRKSGAPAGFHRGLLPHYERLVRGRRVGIVTCHERLGRALVDGLGAAAVDLRRVPMQAKYATAGKGAAHWPDRFRELQAELSESVSGGLWLVAAGMLGKVYCETIRAAGGVALDIGHVADVWAGFATRTYDQSDVLNRWRLVPEITRPAIPSP